MSAASLIETAALEGIEIRMVNGELKVAGNRATVDRWLPIIRQHKAELLEALRTEAPAPIPDCERERLASWLRWIGEDDPTVLAAFWKQASDPEARRYFLGLADALAKFLLDGRP